MWLTWGQFTHKGTQSSSNQLLGKVLNSTSFALDYFPLLWSNFGEDIALTSLGQTNKKVHRDDWGGLHHIPQRVFYTLVSSSSPLKPKVCLVWIEPVYQLPWAIFLVTWLCSLKLLLLLLHLWWCNWLVSNQYLSLLFLLFLHSEMSWGSFSFFVAK